MKKMLLLFLALTFTGPLWLIVNKKVDFSADYRTANRDSAGLAPDPKIFDGAVIQAYAARAFNWRGAIASHSWIAVKPKGAKEYSVYQVVGWRAYHGLPVLVAGHDIPDRNWFDQKPRVILDIRGERAEALIPKVMAAAESYPYPDQYTLWPGPNSNTFTAYVARQVPELGLALPSDAIGKDFVDTKTFITKAPSGTGYQVSLFGALGVLVAREEGLEVNFLGLVYGVKPSPFSVLLPGLPG